MSKLSTELEEKFAAKKATLVKELTELAEMIARSAKRLESTQVLDSYLGLDSVGNVERINRLVIELATIQNIAQRAFLLEAREEA